MNHLVLTFIINHVSLWFCSKRKDIDTSFTDTYEILLSFKHQTSNLTLPQLEALMNVERCSSIDWTRNVLNNHIEGVDKNCLVGNDELLEVFACNLINTSENKQVAIVDV
jgi:hypothetical protein|tara:strand:- start:266 stop:595 length:330 start_codon:yes stop_codon:yes gene_type:complete